MSSTCLSMVFTQDKASINKGGVRSNLGANASAKIVFEDVQDHAGPLLRASFFLLKHFHAGSQPLKTLSGSNLFRIGEEISTRFKFQPSATFCLIKGNFSYVDWDRGCHGGCFCV